VKMYAIDFTKLAGTPKLFLDFINCREPACRFYRYDFKELDSYRSVAEKIDNKSYRREELATIITGATSRFDLSVETAQNIKRLTRPDSLCIFAGQQAGILLGPMYTILKALTAYKLSKRLEAELDRPVIPCFWMATDDHDFDEVKTAGFLDRDGNCKLVSYEPEDKPSGQPVASLKFDNRIENFISSVEEILIDTEFKETVKGWLRKIYEPGKQLSESFGELFETVTRGFGIVPVDPNFPGMKALFEPVFKRDIENHDQVFELFENRSKEIVDCGYHRQVHKPSNALNLFINDGIRRNIIIKDNSYYLDGHSQNDRRPGMNILDLLGEKPEIFSPNVILRPVTQCFAFPTVSQIVGPSEAAYFAQIAPLFDFHNVPWPVIRPRLFATLIEPQITKIMHKLSIDFGGLVNDIEFEVARVIRENYPPEIQQRAESLRSGIENPLRSLGESIKSRDLESFQALEHARRKIDHELNHLSKKLFMAHKKQHDEVNRRVHKAAAFLLPCGKYQERILTPIYFTDKFGPNIFKWLAEQLDLDSTGHQLLEIGS
jgi:bacillithiol biosynthesis cysteine-adding enzyme BshC